MVSATDEKTTSLAGYQPDGARFLGAKRALGRVKDAMNLEAPRFQRVLESLGRKIDAQDEDSIRAASALLVSQLFLQPLLAEARELPFGGDVGDGGRGEEIFGEQLDQRLGDLVAQNLPGLTSQIESKLSASKQATDAPATALPQADWKVELQRQEAL